MAESIFRGMIRSKAVAAASVHVFEIFPARRDALVAMELGIDVVISVEDLISACDIVILATKPDAVPTALQSCRARWLPDMLLLSICAGVKMDTLVSSLDLSAPAHVVRAMPNLACSVGAAATAICCNSACTAQDRSNAIAVMRNVGVVEEVHEKLMDAVTGFSGSSPGFTFMFIEALADAAVMQGIPRTMARKFAAQVVYGSAKIVLEEPKTHPAELRNRVESPGGTTIAGTQAMEAAGFRAAVVAGVSAATKRSSELGAASEKE
jgi:pyrroline-5-carboxylate reductase